jgi:replicative DNA helicase
MQRSRRHSSTPLTDNIPNTPPHNIEAERKLLGAAMLSSEVLGDILEEIDVDAFYLENHRKIFTAIKSLFNRGKPVDAVNVAQELQMLGPNTLEQVGGMAYLSDLCADATAPSLALSYIEIIKRAAVLRDLIRAGQQITELGFHPDSDDPREVLDRAEAILYKVSSSRVRDRFEPLNDVIEAAYNQLDSIVKRGGVTGVPTGFKELDRTLLGLQPSDLIIVAARPGMGKTSFALSIARNAAIEGRVPVGIFSLEMSKIQLAQRLLSAEAMISSHTFRVGLTRKEDTDSLLEAIETLSKAKIFIDDSPSLSITEIRTKARRLKNKEDVQLIVIDYLQLIQGDSSLRDRYQQVAEISRSLKILAKELDIPVIALSQLSREIEKRGDNRPKLSDLRESGSIEQDADVVIFLYVSKEDEEQEVQERKGPKERTEAETKTITVEIAKHRNGPTKSFKLLFMKDYTKFSELETTEYY